MERGKVNFPPGAAAISAHQDASLNVILIWCWELEFDVRLLSENDVVRMEGTKF
jgi:hypothetical protein